MIIANPIADTVMGAATNITGTGITTDIITGTDIIIRRTIKRDLSLRLR